MPRVKKSKRFRYNLASTLKVREIRETLQKEVVTKARLKLREEQEKLETIRVKLTEEHDKILEMYSAGKPLDMGEIFLRKHRLELLKVEEDEQVKAVEQAEENKNKEEKKLLKAMQDRKILEKDREKKNKLWRKLMDKEETKFLDEISTSRFFRSDRKGVG
ncbi:MAG: flagellar FliJ family protein [Candidatus Margulisiibacteriota bacterium]